MNRSNNQIPAVTKVELCTKALTGVGAAMAAGSHLANGHCALLVKDTSASPVSKTNPLSTNNPQDALNIQYAIVINNRASPSRLVNKVRSPPLALIQLW